jgi:SAM-dependent methyltransferase
MTLTPHGPNADQIEYWNQTSGPRWVKLRRQLDGQIHNLGERALTVADVRENEHVLDIGCGCGATCLALARRVGPGGSVLGVDISGVMLERGRERAREAGLDHVEFVNLDAQTHAFDPATRDLVFSRFGVMFFAHPVDAFTNLRRTLRPGGRLAFVCWRGGLEDNAWMRVPVDAVRDLVELPPRGEPDAPGPFRRTFADRDALHHLLHAAGFTDIAITADDVSVPIAGGVSLDETVAFSMTMGPHSRPLQEADDATRQRAADAIRDALAPHATDDGVSLPGAIHVVRAVNPA